MSPDRRWVADNTSCRTFAGWVYAAFVLDVRQPPHFGLTAVHLAATDLGLDAPSSRWPLPGGRAGQPLTPGALRQHLQAFGMPTDPARTAALSQHVLQAPAPACRRRPRLPRRTVEHHRLAANCSNTLPPAPVNHASTSTGQPDCALATVVPTPGRSGACPSLIRNSPRTGRSGQPSPWRSGSTTRPGATRASSNVNSSSTCSHPGWRATSSTSGRPPCLGWPRSPSSTCRRPWRTSSAVPLPVPAAQNGRAGVGAA